MGEWIIGIITWEYIGTTIGIHSLLRDNIKGYQNGTLIVGSTPSLRDVLLSIQRRVPQVEILLTSLNPKP